MSIPYAFNSYSTVRKRILMHILIQTKLYNQLHLILLRYSVMDDVTYLYIIIYVSNKGKIL